MLGTDLLIEQVCANVLHQPSELLTGVLAALLGVAVRVRARHRTAIRALTTFTNEHS
jgi:hypothetical protein